MKRLLRSSHPVNRSQVATRTVPGQSSVNTPFYYKLSFIRYDAIIGSFAIFAGIAFLSLVLLLAFSIAKLPPYLPLFYSLPWGERQLIALPFFTLLPILIPVVFTSNMLLCVWLYRRYQTIVRLLFFSTALFALLLAITAAKIILLVVG